MTENTCRFTLENPEENFCAESLTLFDARSQDWLNPLKEPPAPADIGVPVGLLWVTAQAPGDYEAIQMMIPDIITARNTGELRFDLTPDPIAFGKLDTAVRDAFARPILELSSASSGLCLPHEDFRAEAYQADYGSLTSRSPRISRSHFLGRGALSIWDANQIEILRADDDYPAICRAILTLDLTHVPGRSFSFHERRSARRRLDQHFKLVCGLLELNPERLGLPEI